MSYTKTVWRDGDVITAAKMNKIEDGIENSLSEKLQALYKTMVGNDWPYQNNPTDAEVIDKIAKDAQSGGSGGGLVFTAHADDVFSLTNITFESLQPGLSISDFDGFRLHVYVDDEVAMIFHGIAVAKEPSENNIACFFLHIVTGSLLGLNYNFATGELTPSN